MAMRREHSTAVCPSVVRFRAILARRESGSSARAVAVEIPPATANELRGVETAEGTINGHPFRAALEAAGGLRSIRVNAAMLRGAAAEVGDVVEFAILGPEGELVVAPDLRGAIVASAAAAALWSELSEGARRIYVRWVDATNDPQTRARRVRRTVEQLAEGKRRPCCVNLYEYPMSRIDPDWLKKTRRS